MTPHDWALLSEWLDGGLTADERNELQTRLQREPELAEAARRLKALAATARTLAPTEADATAWRQTARGGPKWLGPLLGIVLLVAVGAGLFGWSHHTAEASNSSTSSATGPSVDGADADAGQEQSGPLAARRVQRPADDLAGITDAAVVSPPSGAHSMPPLDASTPVAVIAPIATVAPGPPIVAYVNPGEPYLVDAAPSQVTVTPAGVADVRNFTDRTHVVSSEPAVLTISVTPRDGGSPHLVELHVEARRDLEFTVLVRVDSGREIWAPGRARFALGSSAIARIIERGDKLEVHGVSPGETNLEVWFTDGAHLIWPIRVSAPPAPGTIELNVGASKVLTMGPSATMRLENPELATMRSLGKQILLQGRQPGTTTLVQSAADGGVIARTTLVVQGASIDDPPLGVETVSISSAPPEQGPLRVRLNRALRLTTATTKIRRVRTTNELVVARFEDGAVLLRGTATGRVVVGVEFHDGAQVQLSIVVDP